MRTPLVPRSRTVLAAPVAALGLLAALPSGAAAATTCSFDAAAAKLTVAAPDAGGLARISRTVAGALQVNGVTCGAATVSNTDTIAVTGGVGLQQVVIDLTNGAFAPGKTAETGAGALSEIEFVVDAGSGGEFPLGDEVRVIGNAAANTFRFSARDVLLNNDADADVATSNAEAIAAEGRGGVDRLDGQPAGLPAATPELRLSGGDAADELAGGGGRDTLDGGAGDDIERGGDDADTFKQGAAANGADTLDGGGSPYDRIDYSARTAAVRIDMDDVADDGAAGERDDVRDSFEYLVGGSAGDTIITSQTRYQPFELTGNGGNDVITGGDNYDDLYGGDGNDTIAGGDGSDTFRGGPGNDVQRGDEGADVFHESDGGGANNADSFFGGDGVDHFYAPDRTAPMTITLADNLANDGEANEKDNVRSDVEDVTTGDGADTVTGASIANKLSGTDGADTLNGGTGDDTLNGGNGTDRLLGGANADKLYGNDDADTLDGGTEGDELRGGFGGDRLVGNFGADKVYGESDDDTIVEPSAKDAADELIGGDGMDTVDYNLRASAVTVTLDGLANDGAQTAPAENDDVAVERVVGSRAGDVLTGSAGDDRLEGAAGADRVQGLGGADALKGGDGDDTLKGGDNDDLLDGGLGGDTLDGEGHKDRATYAGRTAPVRVTLGTGANDGESGEQDDVQTEDVLGGDGADILTGDGAANQLDGARGDDVLDGGPAADVFYGRDGSDTVTYATRTTRVFATLDNSANDGQDADGNEHGEEGDFIDDSIENLTGSSAGDILEGNGAGNTLRGGTGDDRLDGRLGADALRGEGGRDTVRYYGRSADLHVNLFRSDATDGEAGEGDSVDADVEIVNGGAGNDRLVGSNADNELYGHSGADTLSGGEAPFRSLDGHDVLSGGEGRDTADYSERSVDDPVKVSIDGVANDGKKDSREKDNVLTDVENLVGGVDDDELIGSDKENVLNGGIQGYDILRGEGGDDRFDEAADPVNFHVDDDEFFGGDGADTIDYSKRTMPLKVTLDDVADDGVPTEDGSSPEGDNVHSDVENILGGVATDILIGNDEKNRIHAGGSNNRVEGWGGDDDLIGGDSADRILGMAGDDKITGRSGNNVLDGGPGDDTFIEDAAYVGNDKYTGFTGRDTVDYSARGERIVADNDAGANDDGQDANRDGVSEEKDTLWNDIEVIVGGSGPDLLTQSRSQSTGHCVALYGGPGQDVLTGHDGARDVLQGGPDGDTLHGKGQTDWLVGGLGNDVENGGDGDDEFIQGTQSQNCSGMSWGQITGGDGADILNGEDGKDQVDYRRSSNTPLRVSLDGIANDGASGEGDQVKSEDVSGGDGDDVIIGNSGENFLLGGRGNDHLEGLGDNDTIWDSQGVDSLFGGDDGDELKTKDGDNADTVSGGGGTDTGEWDDGDTQIGLP